MAKKEVTPAARFDDENPEWTRTEIRDARPALDVVSEVFGVHAADSIKRGRGRPPKSDKKINQTLRLDADVVQAYRQEGQGWQTRINQVLREHMPQAEFKAKRNSV
jgi:uncharacterized protein (DUF4415 family)